MSTRSNIILVERKDGKIYFHKNYCHWDGYPEGVGEKYFQFYKEIRSQEKSKKAIFRNILNRLFLYHPEGWSVFNEICYCHSTLHISFSIYWQYEKIESKDLFLKIANDIVWIYILDIEKENFWICKVGEKLFQKVNVNSNEKIDEGEYNRKASFKFEDFLKDLEGGK